MQGSTKAKVLLAAGAVALGACGYTDGDAPAAPQFDLGGGEDAVVWRLPKITLEGSAEFGASVKLEADKGQTLPGPQIADVYTARFRFAGVPLVAGLNTFTVTATDDAGNASEKGTLKVEYRDVPQGLELGLSATTLTAGSTAADGQLRATARVLPGVDGFVVKGRKIVFELAGAGEASQEATTDDSGRATVTFPTFTRTGAGTVTAYFNDKTGTSDQAAFTVVGGPAASLQLKLVKSGATGDGADTVTVTAGEDVEARIVVKDAQGNAVPVPVAIFTDQPGALVSGTKLTNLRSAGTWRVVASVYGAPTDGGHAVSDEATVTVNASGDLKVAITGPAEAGAGDTVRFAATVTDAFGNPVTPGSDRTLTFSAPDDPDAVVSSSARTVVFHKAGAMKIVASLAGAGNVSAQWPITIVPGAAASMTLAFAGTNVRTTPEYAVAAAAGAAISVTASVKDAFENVVTAGVALSTNSPGAFDGTTLKNLTKAGSYEVRAQVVNSAVTARKAFAVLPGAGQAIHLALATGLADAGTTVPYTLAVTDAFGNAATDPVAIVVDGLGAADFGVDASAGTLVVRKSADAAYTVRARPVTGTTPAAATASLFVRPGAAQSVSVDVGGSNTYTAGTTPTLVTTVKDAFNNVLANPPLTISIVPQANTVVEPPGPIFSAGKIYNLIRPGSYQVVAQVAGTGVVNAQTDSEATLTVTAAASASVDLSLSRATADVGSPVDVRVAVRDAYGNATADAATVSVLQGTTTVAANVGASWTGSAAGTYSVKATVAAVTPNLTDTETLVVTAPPDTKGPTLTIDRPLNDPTVATWPPPDRVTTNTCTTPANGDVASVTATDGSLVSDAWLTVGGYATNPSAGALTLGVPTSPFQSGSSVCANPSSGGSAPLVRGEVLVQFAATDLRGNYSVATGSWCVDPDAGAYLPANPPATRCVVAKAAELAGGQALGANDAGDLALLRVDASDAALLQLFERSPGYGAGIDRPLKLGSQTLVAPRGVAMSGRTAFSAVVGTAKAYVMRTRGLDKTGAGTDDAFLTVDSNTERVEGLAFGFDGSLYALNVQRSATSFQSKLYKLDSPLDATKTYTALPTTPVATSTSLRLGGLCRGARAGEFYATGVQASGSTTKAVVARIVGSTITTLFTDTVEGRAIGGCALTAAGLVTTLSKAGTPGVYVVDTATGALAAAPLMSGYTSSAALANPLGVALANGYAFVATTETTTGSLLRFARPGGF